jgi:hypothetical protein
MQRLKRVFNIDIETCERCVGQVKIIASIEDPAVIERILAHLNGKASSTKPAMPPEGRAPPQARLGVPASSIEPRILSSLLLLLFWRWRFFYWIDAGNWSE